MQALSIFILGLRARLSLTRQMQRVIASSTALGRLCPTKEAWWVPHKAHRSMKAGVTWNMLSPTKGAWYSRSNENEGYLEDAEPKQRMSDTLGVMKTRVI